MQSSFVEKWSKKRTIGKRKYIARYGLLLFGAGCVVLFSVLDLVNNGAVQFPYLIARLVFFPSIGALFAGMRWESNERKYARLTGAK
ncbi:hypothetical protein [Cohnella thermotolerans]|uniref:hypothetical protein n=1 Tax=Cohnella thermotolerans TaxID=329858 RepID=UPI0004284FA7|nr:hypothetical protein [Cohnella thermotolerans]